MKTRFEIYRDKAQECERLAMLALDSNVKRQLITIARQWREMADQQERNPSRIVGDPPP